MTTTSTGGSVRESIDRDGFTIIPNVLSKEYIARARPALERAVSTEAEYHGGESYSDFGMVLLCALYGDEFLELFDNEAFLEPFEAVMGPGCIVYAYTSSSMPPSATNFSRRIHVDCPRLIPGYVTNMGATILLDDFTEENGATSFLPGSHTRAEAPSEEEWERDSQQVIAPAGSVFFFNARLWHRGGSNLSQDWRHALTVNMCRPFMKQRLDIPRALEGAGVNPTSERVRQKLGYDAQVPVSYDEYYQPPELRKFRQPAE